MHRISSERLASRFTSISRAGLHLLALVFLAMAMASHGIAQAPAGDAGGGGSAPQASPEELENLVGRIALYPDDLVAIILPGSTNPLQIVQADRFLDKRKSDPKLQLDEKWDDSVKALVNYPDVVKMMSGDLDWTSALGEAVVADQAAVLDAVQAFRRRAQAAGNLKSNEKQVVNVDKTVIEIVPANPEVIYVPQYNPTTVVVAGAPAWGYYPTPYPVYYYPYAPGAAFATGLIWGAAIGAAWGGARWGTNWGGGDININRNTNINTGDINRGNVNRGNASQLPANRGGAGGSTAWKSDKRPGQVSGATGRTNTTGRVGDAGRGAGSGGVGGAGAASRPSASSGSVGANAGANRPSPGAGNYGGGAAQRAGTASASPRDSFGGSGSRGGTQGGGFSGYGSGRQTSMDSSRGASSRSSMSGGGYGGGARGGGGGGARGGGGGGRGGGGRR